MYIHGGVVNCLNIPGEGKGLFKVFDYTRSMYVGAHVSYCIIALK